MKKLALMVLLGLGCIRGAWAQLGGIRGSVMDADYEAPMPAVKILVPETGQEAATDESGNFFIEGVEPGSYTLMFTKAGYTRSTKSEVVVTSGQLVDLEVSMQVEYEDMDELVVKDIQLGGASEIGLLNMRLESSSLMDAVGADLMSKAGVSDAAQALTLVPGTTVQDGKYAVVRGLPDRYVSAQMNSVRLPTADPDKRAVQLDQFPSAMIESMQVAKTFTPDQQADASGGAVNVVLKGIPDEPVLKFKVGTKFNSNLEDAGNGFLVDNGVSLSTWGQDADSMGPASVNTPWTGRFGVSRGEAPAVYDWSLMAGNKFEIGSELKLGFLGSVFYKRSSSFYENGKNDKYFLDFRPYGTATSSTYGSSLVPRYGGTAYGLDYSSWPFTVGLKSGEEVQTSLFDVSKGTEKLQWGTLGALGAEVENHSLKLLYSYNFSAENTAYLAEDTRGKYYFFPQYNPADPTSPGGADSADGDFGEFAPFRRSQVLEYVERTASSLQLQGKHTIPVGDKGIGSFLIFGDPEVDWTLARSGSRMDTPDRRSMDSSWYLNDSGTPIHSLESGEGGITLLLRKWREVEENSDQYFTNLKFPYEVWNGEEGFLKFGVFEDQVERSYGENSFYLSAAEASSIGNYTAGWNAYWGDYLSGLSIQMEDYPLDVSYDGEQDLSAWYYMAEFPVFSFLKFTGGARMESTDISTSMRNVDAKTKLYIPSNNYGEMDFQGNEHLANASVVQNDVLPALGLEFTPMDTVTFRGSYTETLARMTFKELAPIQQVDNVGDDIFIGNPELQMSALKNYDLRFDYNPYPGGLVSMSWFRKTIQDPIDYRQVLLGGSTLATTADNYSEGLINGYEFEVRQSMGEWWAPLAGLNLGGNVTLIDSELNASGAEIANLDPAIIATEYGGKLTRDMMGAPEYLYNLNASYTVPKWGTELSLFYTVKGDALKAAGTQESGNYIPHVYEKEYATLNFSLSHKLSDHLKLGFKVKNLLNPEVRSVYRSGYTGEEVDKTSYKKGVEFSLELSATW